MALAIIGDFSPNTKSHIATNCAIEHSAKYLGVSLDFKWIPTDTISRDFNKIINEYDSFWIAPGGNYNDAKAVLDIIKYSRINNKPTIGTCSGFQQMVIEHARNVLGIKNAAHAEYNPIAPNLVITPLNCNIKGRPLKIAIAENSMSFQYYGTKEISESYYCSFGINPQFQNEINNAGFRIVGSDRTKEARILELKNHMFFIATLFVPQVNSSFEAPNKLITSFIKADEIAIRSRKLID